MGPRNGLLPFEADIPRSNGYCATLWKQKKKLYFPPNAFLFFSYSNLAVYTKVIYDSPHQIDTPVQLVTLHQFTKYLTLPHPNTEIKSQIAIAHQPEENK